MTALATDLSIAVLTHENPRSAIGALGTLPDQFSTFYGVF